MDELFLFDDEFGATISDVGYQQSDIDSTRYDHDWDWSVDEISASDDSNLTVLIAADAFIGRDLDVVWPDEFALLDQLEGYEEPFLPSDEWSGPIQPNAPPMVFDELIEWNEGDEDLALDSYLLIDAVVAPPAVVEDAWDWSSEEISATSIPTDYQQIDGIVAPTVQFFGAEPELSDEEPDEFHADHFGTEDADPVLLQDDFDWSESVEDDLRLDEFANSNAVVSPAQYFGEDAELLDETLEDDWQVIVDDDDDAIQTNSQPAQLVEDAWDWSNDDSDDPIVVDDYANVDVVIQATQIVEDAWNHFDESVEDDWQLIIDDDDDASQDVTAPSFYDAWTWEESADDDLPEDSFVGPNGIVPPSQFTDDAWDWTQHLEIEDQVDEPPQPTPTIVGANRTVKLSVRDSTIKLVVRNPNIQVH